MSKEYIEREKYVKLNDIIETLEHEWGYEGMREDLYNLPAADVATVRHGEWEEVQQVGRNSRHIKYTTKKCSVCGYWNGRRKTNYCPCCGAKMDMKEGD